MYQHFQPTDWVDTKLIFQECWEGSEGKNFREFLYWKCLEIMFHNKPAINLWLSLNISWKVFLGMGEWRLNLHFNQKFLSFENYFSPGGVMWKFYSPNNIIALALSNYICVGKSNYTNWSAMSYQLPLILIPPLSISLLLSTGLISNLR